MERVDLLKLAIDDTRVRLRTWHDLILFVDRQASELLRQYVTLAVAAVPVTVSFYFNPQLGPSAAGGLAAAALFLVAGAIACFIAIDRPSIELPGRDGDFWEWARANSIDADGLVTAYLASADESAKESRRANARQATGYRMGRWLGIAAAPIGFLVFYLMSLVS